jgi:hypothetical protein
MRVPIARSGSSSDGCVEMVRERSWGTPGVPQALDPSHLDPHGLSPSPPQRPVEDLSSTVYPRRPLLAALTRRRTLGGRPRALPTLASAVTSIGWRVRTGKRWCRRAQGEPASNGQCENKTSHGPCLPLLMALAAPPTCRRTEGSQR